MISAAALQIYFGTSYIVLRNMPENTLDPQLLETLQLGVLTAAIVAFFTPAARPLFTSRKLWEKAFTAICLTATLGSCYLLSKFIAPLTFFEVLALLTVASGLRLMHKKQRATRLFAMTIHSMMIAKLHQIEANHLELLRSDHMTSRNQPQRDDIIAKAS
jgi:hypothetical protein